MILAQLIAINIGAVLQPGSGPLAAMLAVQVLMGGGA